MNRLFITLFALIGIIWLSSCDIANNEVEPGISFTKIYDDRQYSTNYDPLSILPTEDGGYLALVATNAWNVYVFKTDADGEFAWEVKVDEAYVNPLSGLFLVDDQYYLFCMNEVTLATSVMHINLAERTVIPATELNEVQYPLAVSQLDDQSFLILGYDRKSRSSTLHALYPDFSINWSKQYAVEEDMEESIIRHMARTGQRLPFFVGTTNDNRSYFFNGFANYTLSLNFVNPQSGDLSGTMNGFRDDEFISAVYHLESNQYAVARSSFGTNSLLPQVEVNSESVASSSDLKANDFPEIDTDARIIIHEIDHHGKPIILFGTHTKKRQLIMYAYDKATGELLGTQYIGQSAPYQMSDFASTKDGGLVILGETFLIGRFSRPCLFKLSPDEVDGFIR